MTDKISEHIQMADRRILEELTDCGLMISPADPMWYILQKVFLAGAQYGTDKIAKALEVL